MVAPVVKRLLELFERVVAFLDVFAPERVRQVTTRRRGGLIELVGDGIIGPDGFQDFFGGAFGFGY